MQPKPTKSEHQTLIEAFNELPDPRVVERCDHLLHEVLVSAVCGLLVGGESFDDMEDCAAERAGWRRGFLVRPGGVPGHAPFNRVFQALCPRAFAECLARWTQGVRERLGSGRAEAAGEVVALVSAWATEHGLALGQSAVAGQSNAPRGAR